MSLDEFWGTTPGEVALVTYAAADRRSDMIESGTYAVFNGRAASYMSDAGKCEAFLKSLSRRGRKAGRRRDVDEKEFRRFIAGETARAAAAIAARKTVAGG